MYVDGFASHGNTRCVRAAAGLAAPAFSGDIAIAAQHDMTRSGTAAMRRAVALAIAVAATASAHEITTRMLLLLSPIEGCCMFIARITDCTNASVAVKGGISSSCCCCCTSEVFPAGSMVEAI